jgi:hypothetical protein
LPTIAKGAFNNKKELERLRKELNSTPPKADPNTIHEGVAPRKDAHKGGIPPNAIWTKLKRQLVNPTVLTAFGEEYVEAEGFIIILRVLSREEIEFFIQATIFHKGLFCLQY